MKTYLVGGAVRDMVLGNPPHDSDYVVFGATPAEMEALGFERVGKDFPVFCIRKLTMNMRLPAKKSKPATNIPTLSLCSDRR